MAGSTRRRLLTGLIGAGLAGGAALLCVRPLRAASAPLRLPEGPMLLERTLVRELGPGVAITVRRWWEVGFARQARGIVVTGTQVAASVDAPPHLAELARIEQQRGTQGMFPILLSESGLIVSHGAAPTAPADIAAALREAEPMIARLPRAQSAGEAMRRYLAELHRAGAGEFDTMPADLFFPSGTPLRRVETVTLPDGLAGAFELVWQARAVPEGGWLDEGEREIVTRIEGFERRSREGWRLRPA